LRAIPRNGTLSGDAMFRLKLRPRYFLSFAALLLGWIAAPAESKHWQPAFPMGNSLYPSFIVATAAMKSPGAKPEPRHLGDWREIAGITFQPVHEDTKLRVEISSTRFIKPSSYEVSLTVPGFVYHIFPPLEFDYAALRAVKEPTPETVTIKVSDISYGPDGRVTTTEETQTVTVHAVTDCPIARGDEDWTWMIAAFVNENSPVIPGILQEALHAGIVTHFAGYQLGEEDVRNQVFAIWFVLQQRGIRYSDITTPSSNGDKITSQTVRLIGESVTDQQANCVDGSVLFASVFRKIGLRTVLVTIPGHCFVVVSLNRNGPPLLEIETTALGEGEPAAGRSGPPPPLAVARQRSMQSFNVAIKRWYDSAQLTGSNPDLHIIDIERWRKQGLNPL
jgi:hypothetical protein